MSSFTDILSAYQQFPTQCQSLMLSTINSEGVPEASYAPFVWTQDDQFYIFVSGLSSHTGNLLKTAKAGILLIEDETAASQIFARRRLSYTCQAMLIERNSQKWEQLCDRFQNRFGGIIDMLRPLTDFQIIQLSPEQGRFVVGFGAAYQVDPNNLSQLLPNAISR